MALAMCYRKTLDKKQIIMEDLRVMKHITFLIVLAVLFFCSCGD